MNYLPDDINIRIAELESTLANCADDHEPAEIAKMEQKLYELNAQLETEKQNPCTFDFTPDPLQILRDQCAISASCTCPLGYKISYTLYYDSNHIDYSLMWDGMTVFSKAYDPAYKEPFRPLTIHQAECIVTDAITNIILERMPDSDRSQANAVFSRLRTWPKGFAPRKPGPERCYILLDEENCRLLQLKPYIPSDIEKTRRWTIQRQTYKITEIVPMPHKGTEGVVVRMVPV